MRKRGQFAFVSVEDEPFSNARWIKVHNSIELAFFVAHIHFIEIRLFNDGFAQ